MAGACPCCGRGFGSFVDYPYVYLSEVSRLVVPKGIAMPYFHAPYFFEIPKAVGDEFAERRKFHNRVKRLFRRPKEPVDGLRQHFGDFFECGGSVWVNGKYGIACFNRDERSLVMGHLDSYVRSLEGMVDSIVTPDMLVPKLQGYSPELLFEIPGSGYSLALGIQTLYSLGWLESQVVDLGSEELASRIKNADGAADIQKLLMENVYKEFDSEQEGVPEGYERVGLYIIGLRPTDTSAVRGLVSGEKFRLKFAEFVFQGRVLQGIG